jgi:hypothetical protein
MRVPDRADAGDLVAVVVWVAFLAIGWIANLIKKSRERKADAEWETEWTEPAATGAGQQRENARREAEAEAARQRAAREERVRAIREREARAQADAERARHVVARPRADLRPLPLSGHVARSEHRGYDAGPVAVAVDEREQVEAVAAGGRRPVARARRVAPVGGESAGQLEREPVVREQDVGEPPRCLGLAAVQPRQLGDRDAGHGHHPARVSPGLAPSGELGDQPLRVGRRFGVVPELGRPDDRAPLVEGHHPVLLSGDAESAHLGRAPVYRSPSTTRTILRSSISPSSCTNSCRL